MRNPWKLTTFALAALFATSALAEKQPQMRDALVNLKQAANALEKASHDKGGHRAKALELTKQAIDQVEKGIKFDNKN